MSETPWKQARNKHAIEAAILNRVLDCDWTLNRWGPLSGHLKNEIHAWKMRLAWILVINFSYVGIIERGVPQAYVCTRASSATLCSVHVLRFSLSLSLCRVSIKRESDTYQNGLGYISDTYPNPYPLVTVSPLCDYILNTLAGFTLWVKMITGRKNYFWIIFGGSTGKSCKSPEGYYKIKFLGNYFSHPVRAPFLRNLCGSGIETGGGFLQDRGSYREKCLGNYFRGLYIKIL